MLTVQPERRPGLGPWVGVALNYQLQQVADRFNLDILVLADQWGHLWASSTNSADAAELAASLPNIKLRHDGEGFARGRRQRRSVVVKHVELSAAHLFLAAQGRRSSRGLNAVAPAVTRILSRLLHQPGIPA